MPRYALRIHIPHNRQVKTLVVGPYPIEEDDDTSYIARLTHTEIAQIVFNTREAATTAAAELRQYPL